MLLKIMDKWNRTKSICVSLHTLVDPSYYSHEKANGTCGTLDPKECRAERQVSMSNISLPCAKLIRRHKQGMKAFQTLSYLYYRIKKKQNYVPKHLACHPAHRYKYTTPTDFNGIYYHVMARWIILLKGKSLNWQEMYYNVTPDSCLLPTCSGLDDL